MPGSWGSWGEYSKCSRSCGGGVQVSERDCNDPLPQNGGRFCLGERKKYKLCHTHECSVGTKRLSLFKYFLINDTKNIFCSYRAQQCMDYNEKPFNGKLYSWSSMFVESKKCALICKNEKHIYSVLAPRAKDGTPCEPGSNNVCLAGECQVSFICAQCFRKFVSIALYFKFRTES